MPISIRYLNDPAQECVIRPTPLVSINSNTQRTKDGNLGKSYQITLKGYILNDLGFPLARDSRTDELFKYFDGSGGYVDATANAGPYKSFDSTQSHNFETGVADNRPERQYVPYEAALDAMFFKQRVLRSLFAIDGQRMEISPIHTDEPAVVCYPRFVDIQFTDGIYTDLCEYTVQLEADTLLNNNLEVDLDGNPIFKENMEESEILAASGRFVESFSDSWSIEVDDNLGESKDLTKSYRITRNISATGKDHYGPGDLLPSGNISANKLKAWEQARDFVQMKIGNEPLSSGYPNVMGNIGSGLINLVNAYEGYNHTRTESISIDDGSYSVTENWLLASGKAYENYNMTITTSIDNPFVNVSIQGEVKGLTSISASGSLYGGIGVAPSGSPYDNALTKYHEISNSGSFGVGSFIYKRANNAVAVELNAQPKSLSLAVNDYEGAINYTLEFDNRPTNIFSGVLTENISVSDTYPGDVFSTIAVIGRETGPILKYGGSRTEYQRNVDITMQLDYNDIPYGSGRSSLLLRKPSVAEPIRSQLAQVLSELSPKNEPGVRKYFISPPVENWEPKQGSYSLNVAWTYEMDI